MAKPSALVVGDNRRSLNWGGRGAGHALIRLLSSTANVSSTVPGSEFLLDAAGYGFIDTVIPARYDHLFLHLYRNRRSHSLFEWWVRLEERLGARDFVSDDPERTAQNIERFSAKIPELRALHQKVLQADVVIINGEGDFVFTTPPRREVLFMLGLMALARRTGKVVLFMNAMLSDCPRTGRNDATVQATRTQLGRCAVVFLRDEQSIDYAKALMPEVVCRLVPDALFGWYPDAARVAESLPANGDLTIPFPENADWFGRLDFSRPFIVVGGSGAATRDRGAAVRSYCALVDRLKRFNHPIVLVEADGPDGFLADVAQATASGFVPVETPIYAAFAMLARASLLVSGRYHPTILAACGGTPAVFLSSSAHKMQSLQQLLGYEDLSGFAAAPSADEIEQIAAIAEQYLTEGNARRRKVAAAAERCSLALDMLPRAIQACVGSSGVRTILP